MERFPVKLMALWRLTFASCMFGALAAQPLRWLEGRQLSWPPTLFLMAAAAGGVLLAYLFQPTEAGPRGLRLMSLWGYRRDLRWDELVEVRHARFYGLQPAFRLVTRDGRVHWIARDTRNLPRLYALAREFGGPTHPLVLSLQTPLYAV